MEIRSVVIASGKKVCSPLLLPCPPKIQRGLSKHPRGHGWFASSRRAYAYPRSPSRRTFRHKTPSLNRPRHCIHPPLRPIRTTPTDPTARRFHGISARALNSPRSFPPRATLPVAACRHLRTRTRARSRPQAPPAPSRLESSITRTSSVMHVQQSLPTIMIFASRFSITRLAGIVSFGICPLCNGFASIWLIHLGQGRVLLCITTYVRCQNVCGTRCTDHAVSSRIFSTHRGRVSQADWDGVGRCELLSHIVNLTDYFQGMIQWTQTKPRARTESPFRSRSRSSVGFSRSRAGAIRGRRGLAGEAPAALTTRFPSSSR